MNVESSVALVTGANRGLGKAYTDALLAAGAAKVYAGARDPASVAITDQRLVPVKLDVTQDSDVHAAAAACADDAESPLRAEMEVNVFGMLRMVRAFAPVLAKNGGGAIANMLSVVSWFVFPFNATYCASKHAALAMTEGVRIQLKSQGTQVVAVYAGFIDTDMAAGFDREKTPPRQVAERTLDGIRNGLNDVHADKRSEAIWQVVRTDPAGLHAQMQQQWDERATGDARSRNVEPA
jgi:NAD(P)-dependent dehydrogenase (short-subunit alcohol dehydrogenase family)